MNPAIQSLHLKDKHERKGDLLYFNGRYWDSVDVGSTGQVLGVASGLPTWVTEPSNAITAITTLLSADFAIDAATVVTVTTAHGLSVTPAIQDVQVTLSESANGDVDDFALGFIKVESVSATNVVVKVNVTTASATAGAMAKLNILVVVGV